MDSRIQQRFHEIIRERKPITKRTLEVGGALGPKSLLNFPELQSSERYAINLKFKSPGNGDIRLVEGNSNEMTMFEDGSFDLVMSNAVLEHDRHFWKSVSEMRRVLTPGGLMIIGVPGFVALPSDAGRATQTFKVHHYPGDYYRFSIQAVEEVFFENMAEVRADYMLRPPRIIASGVKP